MSNNEDKENALMFTGPDARLETTVNAKLVAETPAHLLKRSFSPVLKPNSNSVLKPGPKLQKNESAGKDISPLRKLCVQQSRLPLASKDNNNSARPNSFLSIRQQQKSALNNGIPMNARKLKKYGSVLGYTTLSRTKSLVLKDLDDIDNQAKKQKDKEQEDDDEEDDALSIKLLGVLDKEKVPDSGILKNKNGQQTGLLHGSSGLHDLLKDEAPTLTDKDSHDIAVEYIPAKKEALEYIPPGHTPFTESEIAKLQTFDSPYKIEFDEEEDGNDERSKRLIPLEPVLSATMDRSSSQESLESIRKLDKAVFSDEFQPIEIEPQYDGTGLTADDLKDLIT